MSPGGIVMLVCGGVALLGFPLDAGWHALFGEDVTLWGPTHLFMIARRRGTLGIVEVMRQGFELGRAAQDRPARHLRVARAHHRAVDLPAEFDFGVRSSSSPISPCSSPSPPASRSCARARSSALGAFQALAMFFASAARWRCSSARSPATRRRTPALPRRGRRRRGRRAGRYALAAAVRAAQRLGHRTLGLAAEWG